MILLNGKAKIVQSREYPVLTGQVVGAEGVALVQAFENGVEVVKPSAGAASEVFMGLSYGTVFTPATKSRVEELVVPSTSTYTVTLKDTPISGQLYIYGVTNSTAQTAGNPATTDNQYSISGNVITFHANRAGNTMRIQYRYSPTVLELQYSDNLMITSFSTNRLTQSISLAAGKATPFLTNLHKLLLVNQDSVSVFERVFHTWV